MKDLFDKFIEKLAAKRKLTANQKLLEFRSQQAALSYNTVPGEALKANDSYSKDTMSGVHPLETRPDDGCFTRGI